MLYVTLLKHPKILREPSSVFEDPSWPLKRSNQPSWGGGRLLLGQRLGAQLCQSQQWTKRSCNVFQMRWLSLSLQTPGTPGGLNGMAWWIWLHVKTAKSVWNEIGICMDLWRVSFSNLCTYEEDFRCCFFPGIMLRLRCRSPSGPVLAVSRFPRDPLLRLVKQNKQLRSQITSTKDRKFLLGTEIPNAPCWPSHVRKKL